jgi:esterase/lipase
MTRLRRRATAAALMVAAGGAVALLGPRYTFEERWVEPDIGADVEQFVAESQSGTPGIRPGERSAIVWSDTAAKVRTPITFVYLHGFSADRHEIDPVVQRVASALGANSYFPRLAGHGRDGDAMAQVTVEEWMDDVAEAVAVGRLLGERVVLVGTSTGGTLAVWAAGRPEARDDLAALVLVSPNFHPADRRSRLLVWPWGRQLARGIAGGERCFDAANEGQATHWTTCYPTEALLPMMALVEHVRTMRVEDVTAPILIVYSRADRVVDPSETEAIFPRFGSATKTLFAVEGSTDPSQHILAGDIMGPETTDELVSRILVFLRTALDAPGDP